jgi:electron transport complex protein RnfE
MLASLLLAATLTSCANSSRNAGRCSGNSHWNLCRADRLAMRGAGIQWIFAQAFGLRLKFFGLSSGLLIALAGLRELFGQGHIGRGLPEHWQGLVLFDEGAAPVHPGSRRLYRAGLLLAARQAWTRSNALPRKHIIHECRKTSGNLPQAS